MAERLLGLNCVVPRKEVRAQMAAVTQVREASSVGPSRVGAGDGPSAGVGNLLSAQSNDE